MTRDEKILDYLKDNDPCIMSIVDVRDKDWDDEDGSMGDHFLVIVEATFMNPKIVYPDIGTFEYRVDKKMVELHNSLKYGITKLRRITP